MCFNIWFVFSCIIIYFKYLVNYLFAKGIYDENAPLKKWQWATQYGLGSIAGLGLLITLIWTKETDVWLKMKNDKKHNKLY